MAKCSLILTVFITILSVVISVHSNYVGYAKINQHLVGRITSDDSYTNMAEAVRWLNDEVKKNSHNDRILLQSLETFTLLPQLLDDKLKCTAKAAEIIDDNYDYGGVLRDMISPTRVATIISDYTLRHAKYCYEYIPKETSVKFQKIDSGVRQRVKLITDMCFTDMKFFSSPIVASEQKSNIIWETLKAASKGDPDEQYLTRVPGIAVHPDQIKNLFKRNILEPCRKYNQALNLDGLERLIRLTFADYNMMSEERRQFNVRYEEFLSCKKIISESNQVVDKLIALAAQK